jgi:hypothetical protein
MLAWNVQRLRKADIVATWSALRTNLKAALSFANKYPGKVIQDRRFSDLADRLWKLDDDVDVLLGQNCDPRECADSIRAFMLGAIQLSELKCAISALLHAVIVVEPDVRECSSRSASDEFIAKELALRVTRVFEAHDQSDAIGTSRVSAKHTNLVRCLHAIGDVIGLHLSPVTWRMHAIAAISDGARLRKKRGTKHNLAPEDPA